MNEIPKNILRMLQQSEDAKLAGNHEEAIKLAQEALVKMPDCVEALEEIADNYLGLDDLEKAWNAANFARELDENSYTANYILGFILSRNNNFEEAIHFLEKANELRPNNAEILRALGWAYFMLDKRLKGIVILERALNLHADDSMILCDLGICYVKNNQADKALDLFYRAMEITPNDERVKECIRLAEEIKGISHTLSA